MLSDQIYSLDLSYLKSLSLNDIEQNLKRFPFAVNLRMLKLLALKSQSSDNFEQALYQEAGLIPDRALLKKRLDQIEEKINSDHLQQPTSEVSMHKIESKKDKIEGLNEESKTNKRNSKSKAKDDSIVDSPAPVTELPEDTVNNILPPIDEDHSTETDSNVINFNKVEDLVVSHTFNTDVMSDNPKNISPEDSRDEELSDFANWLKAQNISKSQTVSISETPANLSDKGEVDLKNPAEEAGNEWKGLQEKILSEYQTDLNASESKPRKKVKNPENKKKKKEKELADETTFITETYALLLEKQQKYQKALKIYDKLCLLFPEKRHYFAQKIELLKNL